MIPPGNILILTQWSFKDALVQTYTLPYVDIIRKIVPSKTKIFVLTAEQERISLTDEEKLNINKKWAIKNMQLIAHPYRRFGIKKFLSALTQLINLSRFIKRQNIKVIHAFCTPAGSMAYILCKMTGAKLIIDSYEPHAEAMVENGTWKNGGPAFKILFALEKRQTRKATAIIATTKGMKDYALLKYHTGLKNFFVKPACVDLEMFSPREKDPELLRGLQFENKMRRNRREVSRFILEKDKM